MASCGHILTRYVKIFHRMGKYRHPKFKEKYHRSIIFLDMANFFEKMEFFISKMILQNYYWKKTTQTWVSDVGT